MIGQKILPIRAKKKKKDAIHNFQMEKAFLKKDCIF